MSSTRAMEELQHKHHHNLVQERQAHKAALESLQGEVQRLADVSRNVSVSSNPQKHGHHSYDFIETHPTVMYL